MRKVIAIAILFALLGLAVGASAAPSVVKFGPNIAFLQTSGDLAVPISLTSDSFVTGIFWAIIVTTNGQPIHPDSISSAGRGGRTSPMDGINALHQLPQTYDTCIFLWNSYRSNQSYCAPPGDGIIAYAWFSGATLGDHLHFEEVPVESLYFEPGGSAYGLRTVIKCGTIDKIPAEFESTDIVVVPREIAITCQDSFNIMSAVPFETSVEVSGYGSSFSTQIVSFTGPHGPVTPPVLTGINPVLISWTPPIKSAGVYHLVVRATDTFNQTADMTIALAVTNSTIQGDNNCDSVVDLTDLARLVAFLTGTGPAPVCLGK